MMADMTSYAENLGLAFQIADDILDVKGSEEEMGKKAGADEKQDKVTYVSLNGLEASEKRLDELTQASIKAIEKYYDNAEFFYKLVLKLQNRNH